MGDPDWGKVTDVLPEAVTCASSLLDADGVLLDTLNQKKCLTDAQTSLIERVRKQDGEKAAARELFKILKKRPKPYFSIFCEVLGKVPQGEDLLKCINKDESNQDTSKSVTSSHEPSATKSSGPSSVDQNREITKDEIIEVAKRIQHIWKLIAKQLGPEPKFESYELHAFEEERNDRNRAQAMLEAWQEKHSKRATRREVILAMKKEKLITQISDLFKCDANDVQ
eukprot:m.45158 g.45158  ORF g.45158 m.45158 type:complete len:225 (+) comp33568_c1_seq2:59-733(+)